MGKYVVASQMCLPKNDQISSDFFKPYLFGANVLATSYGCA
jgi:hypothetical protein